MTRSPRIAVVYTHFPHYRAPVFDAMSRSDTYDYAFYYDPKGIETTIANGTADENHHDLPVHRCGGLMWQGGAIMLARDQEIDGFIFLGNPLILSTWIAALSARLRRKPVFFWTHGWTRRDKGLKGLIRRTFYRLADGLLVYGVRAREIGMAEGFDPARIHVIYNSLDYPAQKRAREASLTTPVQETTQKDLPEKPFFLSVSRLVESVELHKAVEAMAKLPPEISLVVVGAGPKRETLEAQARRLGVDVRFFGAIYDENRLAPLFLGARAVVSPGKVGLLAMHALGYGTPVITHNDFDRQMPEVEAIDPGRTGAFFRHGDVADLARQMTLFLEQSTEAHIASRDASISCIEERYTPEAQVTLITAALDTKMRIPLDVAP